MTAFRTSDFSETHWVFLFELGAPTVFNFRKWKCICLLTFLLILIFFCIVFYNLFCIVFCIITRPVVSNGFSQATWFDTLIKFIIIIIIIIITMIMIMITIITNLQ